MICPRGDTEAVRQLLLAEEGATHVVVLDGAAVEPAGDVVEAEVTREAVDRVLAALADRDLRRTGAITLDALDTVMSDAADAAEAAVPGDPSDAVIWDELVERTGEDSRLSVSFQAFLTIACLLAAIGAVTNSPVTVVGAMVLGPEFGPLAAIAVGIVLRRGDLLRRGAVALVAGFPLAMLVTGLAALFFRAVGLLTIADLDPGKQIDFIYKVGWFSLIVALLAGAAGMLALTSAKSATLVGVFISVTTVPAAGYAAVAAVEGRWSQAASSIGQLGTNLLGIVVAAVVVLFVARRGALARHLVRDLAPGR